jgi:hypothetical protein
MNINTSGTPDAATGNFRLAANEAPSRFGDKAAVAELAGGFSKRWVDDQLRRGMPHLRLGSRRTRFDLEEVREWLKTRYGQQRIAPAKTRAA